MGDVAVDAGVNAWVLHLDHNIASVVGSGAVDLSDGGGSEGLFVEVLEQQLGRAAQLTDDLVLYDVIVHRWSVPLEAGKRGHQASRPDVPGHRGELVLMGILGALFIISCRPPVAAFSPCALSPALVVQP